MAEAYRGGTRRGNYTFVLGDEGQPELEFVQRRKTWVAGVPPSQAGDIVFMYPWVRPGVDVTSELLQQRGISLVYQVLPDESDWVPHPDRGFPVVAGSEDSAILDEEFGPGSWARSRGATTGHNETASTSLVLPAGASPEYLSFLAATYKVYAGPSHLDAVHVSGYQQLEMGDPRFTATPNALLAKQDDTVVMGAIALERIITAAGTARDARLAGTAQYYADQSRRLKEAMAQVRDQAPVSL